MKTKQTHRIKRKGGMIVACVIAFSTFSTAAGFLAVNATTTAGHSDEGSVSNETSQDSNECTTCMTETSLERDIFSVTSEKYLVAEVPEPAIDSSYNGNSDEVYGTISTTLDVFSEVAVMATADIANKRGLATKNEATDIKIYCEDASSYEVSEDDKLEMYEEFGEKMSTLIKRFDDITPDDKGSKDSAVASNFPLTCRVNNLNLSREEVIHNAVLDITNEEYEKLCKMVMAESGFCSWEMQNGCASAAINEAIRQKTSLWDALTYPGRFVYTANFNGCRRAVTMQDINASVYDAVNQALLGYDVNYETIGGSYGFWAPNYCSQKTNNYFYAHVRGTCMIENVCFYHDWT